MDCGVAWPSPRIAKDNLKEHEYLRDVKIRQLRGLLLSHNSVVTSTKPELVTEKDSRFRMNRRVPFPRAKGRY